MSRFVIRDLPAETVDDARIRGGPLELLLLLLRRADGRTGELKIKDHWFRHRELWKMSGLSYGTFTRRLGILVKAGYVDTWQPRTTITKNGRKWTVKGPAEYTAFRKSRLLLLTQKRPQSEQDVLRATHKQSGSSTSHSSTSQSTDPSTLRPQFLSEPTNGAGGGVGPPHRGTTGGESVSRFSSSSSESTSEKPDDDERKPTANIFPCCPPEGDHQRDENKTNGQLSIRVRTWAETRILSRAKHPVENPSALLRTALPEFLANLESEVVGYLVDLALPWVQQELHRQQNHPLWGKKYPATIPGWQFEDFIRAKASDHDLPVSPDQLQAIGQAVRDRLGLKPVT